LKYAILGDVHANLDALETVVQAIRKEKVDAYFCVGDLVGYGSQPSECIKIIRELKCETVAGNHDHATVGKTPIEFFNPDAKLAVEWTRNKLSQDEIKYLDSLPYVIEKEDFTVAHATLHTPQFFEYIQTIFDAQLSFDVLKNSICFLGHSHVPVNFLDTMPISYNMEPKVKLQKGRRILCNVGSVGQPRDGNPRAAWGLYDTAKKQIEVKRVEYDIGSAARKIIDAGLPRANAERLYLGR
jgi:diadenosine tetraphosphatase ApaH/serine/threonine PP2A family protein phosphatase